MKRRHPVVDGEKTVVTNWLKLRFNGTIRKECVRVHCEQQSARIACGDAIVGLEGAILADVLRGIERSVRVVHRPLRLLDRELR